MIKPDNSPKVGLGTAKQQFEKTEGKQRTQINLGFNINLLGFFSNKAK